VLYQSSDRYSRQSVSGRRLTLSGLQHGVGTERRQQCFFRRYASNTLHGRQRSPPAPACSDCISLFPVQQLYKCRCLVSDVAVCGAQRDEVCSELDYEGRSEQSTSDVVTLLPSQPRSERMLLHVTCVSGHSRWYHYALQLQLIVGSRLSL